MNTKPVLPGVETMLGAFAAAGPATPTQVQHLAASNQALDQDAKFLADLQKANVVTALRQAMDKRCENQSAFAQRWGKSRQYVSRIFNIEEHTNFTIDTIAEAAVLLGMRVTVQIHRPEQEVVVRSRMNSRNAYRPKPPLCDQQRKALTPASSNYHGSNPPIHSHAGFTLAA